MNIEHDRNTAKRQLTVVTTVKDVIVPVNRLRIVLEKNKSSGKKEKKKLDTGKTSICTVKLTDMMTAETKIK
jgi:hypothetical protein